MASHEIIQEPRIVLTLELSEAFLLVKIMHAFVPLNTEEGAAWTYLLNELYDAITEATKQP